MSDSGCSITLFRHGIAEKKGGKPDEMRALTSEGHERMKEIAPGLAAFLEVPDAICTSPLVRCVETAEWLARAWDQKLTKTDALRPGAGAEAFRDFLDSLRNVRRIICVGHEPGLTGIMLDLCGIRIEGEIELEKGGCYGVRIPPAGPAQLLWMLPPRVLGGHAR